MATSHAGVFAAALMMAVTTAVTADAAAGPLPPSAVPSAAELPAVGNPWSEVRSFPRTGPQWNRQSPPCWNGVTEAFGETDGIDASSSASKAGTLGHIFTNVVLRFPDRARADAVVARWRAKIADCAIPVDPVGGSLYIKNVRKAATVSGVDVWGYDFGASGYQFSPYTNYAQFFVVQRENVLSFVGTTDYVTIEPHPLVAVQNTITAIQRRLAELG